MKCSVLCGGSSGLPRLDPRQDRPAGSHRERKCEGEVRVGRGDPAASYEAGEAERENIVVVKTICALLDARRPLADGRARESLITYVKDRPGHDLRYAIDATKIETELGWKADENFETGIKKTIEWYLKKFQV